MDGLRRALSEHFGFDDFRPGQRPVVEAILEGRPTVAVMPTGAGKSLCFQLPALERPGVALVVSPLISLMKDQVDSLRQRGVRAAYVNSSQSPADQQAVLEAARAGELELLYVAPERFRFERAMASLREVELSLFVVDEAHCISKWGHDFRPDYRALGDVIRALGDPPVAAFTATATPEVQVDIAKHLNMVDPYVHVSGFMRDNLHLGVVPIRKMAEKDTHMVSLIRDIEGSAIVYCATRRHCEEVAARLRTRRIEAVAYHAGLDDETRDRVQEGFLSGAHSVICATNAFGMGIDKSDVRAVVHYDLPGSLEAYYQEVGRAGRDGQRSRCVLLFTYADTRIHEFFISRAGEGLAPAEQAAVMDRERRKLRDMTSYAYDEGCRHSVILRHFGDSFVVGPEGCGGCDRCTGETGIPGLAALPPDAIQPRRARGASRRATPEHALRALEEEEVVIVQKVLSAVARSKGRLGVADLARILRGSNRAEIVTDPLAASKSFGILGVMSHPMLTALIRALRDAGCVKGQRPVLTPTGADVMWRRSEVLLAMPTFSSKGRGRNPRSKSKGTSSTPPRDLSSDERALLEALKDARKEAAFERGVPAYRIATNKVLEGLLELRSGADRETWLGISGVGPVNVDPLREVFEPVFEALSG